LGVPSALPVLTEALLFQSQIPIRPAAIKLPKKSKKRVNPLGSAVRIRGRAEGVLIAHIIFG
jgi:hypothetical protein